MPTEELQELLNKYLTGNMTSPEIARFRLLLHAAENKARIEEYIEVVLKEKRYQDATEADVAALYKAFKEKAGWHTEPTGRRAQVHRLHFLRRWGWAAASIILLLAGGYFYSQYNDNENQLPANAFEQAPLDADPGKNGAVLTLADGSRIILDSLGNGVVAMQNGTQVTLNEGQLVYDNVGKPTGPAEYNTISTPKGRQFQILLPDGSRVWLNAASSLQYPTVFEGRERQVEISGEAYFEVAQNPKMPFKVKINEQTTVEVLGTEFNINSYAGEGSITTTLLTGSLRLVMNTAETAERAGQTSGSALLKPGQQAQIINAASGRTIKILNNANVEKAVAWKNGLFNFEGASLKEVMTQLERWYDMEVVYPKGVPAIFFEGKIGRDLRLVSVLEILEGSEVHFRVEEGRKLVVLP